MEQKILQSKKKLENRILIRLVKFLRIFLCEGVYKGHLFKEKTLF